jgi:enoyl-[acyl-carrier protein] reductase I
MSATALLQHSRGIILGVSSAASVGHACAAAFRAQGAHVGITHRSPAAAGLAAELGCAHAELEATDDQSVARAIGRLGNDLDGIDFLVHTLVHVPEGVLDRPLHEISAPHFAEVLEIGVRSLLVACRHALPFWRRSRHPRLVALASTGGERAIPGYHAVGIAKAALASAVRYLAQELGPDGVLCNTVSFSAVDTEGARRAIGAERLEKTRLHLARRALTRQPVELDQVTSALAFFASPACQNITGELVTVDGGFSRSYF